MITNVTANHCAKQFVFYRFTSSQFAKYPHPHIHCTAFANDIFELYSCCYVTSFCDELFVELLLNQLCEWSDTWHLSIAVQKCFTGGRERSDV